jgi:uncharacterized ion transporter superfamily protein YfcC
MVKKKRQIPNTYVIVFFIVLIAAAATWIVPGGSFEREKVTVNGVERSLVVKDSFHATESHPQSWETFSAIFDGFVDKADIVVFILLIGAAFWVINTSKALDIGIIRFLNIARKLERFRLFRWMGIHNLLIVLIMLFFSVFGAVFGMSEETIAFVIIFVPLAIRMGYDSIVGVCMCFVGAGLGFAGALMNPFTIGIAQGIAQLPLFSGMEYRLFMWIVINIYGIAYVLWYANKVKKNPSKSVMYSEDDYWRKKAAEEEELTENKAGFKAWFTFGLTTLVLVLFTWLYPSTMMTFGNAKVNWPAMAFLTAAFIIPGILMLRKSIQLYIMHLLLFSILVLIVGVLGYEWYVREIATMFFAMGLLAGIAMAYQPNELVKQFIDGAKDIFSAAFIVGLAGGIIILLQNGGIIDTLLYNMANAMEGGGKVGTISGMYGITTAINLIMPSGSAKAALIMPLMAPFSDLIGISRQASVVAFQLGDGFTNMITPVSGVLLGVLSVAKIPYEKWFRWVLPFMIGLVVIGFLLLLPTVMMELNGF